MDTKSVTALYAEQCASEPIHLLGTVQPHGYIMVVSLEDGVIIQVSEGVTFHYDEVTSARELIGEKLIHWVNGKHDVLSQLRTIPSDELHDLSLKRRFGALADQTVQWRQDAECTCYRSGVYAVLEWVPFASQSSISLKDSFNGALTQVLTHANEEQDIPTYLTDVAKRLQHASGYQRIMIYKFLEDWSGEIIAEATREDTSPKYLGLRFPATDIPPQARALYLKNRLRILADVDAPPDRLIPATLQKGELLDQSMGLLRAMSQAHLVYLKNMGVRATLTVSIIIDGKLWGMIACHHDSPLVPPSYIVSMMRSTAIALSSVISMRVSDLLKLALSKEEQEITSALMQYRDLILQGNVLESSASTLYRDIKSVFEATLFGISIHGKLVICQGDTFFFDTHISHALQALVSSMSPLEIRSWSEIPKDLDTLPWPKNISGLLLGRFDNTSADNYFFITRENITKVIDWAGAPDKFVTAKSDGKVHLEPRRSFEKWQEVYQGESEPWSLRDKRLASKLLSGLSGIFTSWEVQQFQRRLAWQSTHDSLTGLLNRQGLQSTLDEVLNKQHSVIACLIDITQFKLINDAMGHDVGDTILQQVGQRLSSVIQNPHHTARIGDDEFVVALAIEGNVEKEIQKLTDNISAQFAYPFLVKDRYLNLSISTGVAVACSDKTEKLDVIKRAGIALSEAKRQQPTRFIVYKQDMEKNISREMTVKREFEKAIINNELRLYYQPKVSLQTNKIVGFEALIRWQHPTLGILGPGYFLPIIENTKIIQEMGKWVIKTALAQLHAWQLVYGSTLSLAINLSFSEIQEDSVLSYLKSHLSTNPSYVKAFHIELTETVLLSDQVGVNSTCQWLREQNISIALDDFGTGYSALSHLLAFNFDYLKIDRSFVNNIYSNENSQHIIKSLLHLAKGVGATVIAEGIEHKEQARWLQEHGCHEGQGYLFSPAVPSHEVHKLIKTMGLHYG